MLDYFVLHTFVVESIVYELYIENLFLDSFNPLPERAYPSSVRKLGFLIQSSTNQGIKRSELQHLLWVKDTCWYWHITAIRCTHNKFKKIYQNSLWKITDSHCYVKNGTYIIHRVTKKCNDTLGYETCPRVKTT